MYGDGTAAVLSGGGGLRLTGRKYCAAPAISFTSPWTLVTGVVLPFALGTAGLHLLFHVPLILAIFAGAAMTATSIGITAITPRSQPDVAELMSQADSACYAAKANGRGRVAIYDAATSRLIADLAAQPSR